MLITGWMLTVNLLSLTSAQGVIQNLEERLNFDVLEGSPAGSVVGKVRKRPGFTYRLQERNSYFDYDDSTGEIRLSRDIDKELLPSDHASLVLLSSEPTYLISIKITILDVNDNQPIFPYAFQNVTISESAQVGSEISLWLASDKDSGENGKIARYEFSKSSQESPFDLVFVPTDAETGTGSLKLRLVRSLDREQQSFYVYNITAYDNGSPRLSGTLNVFVKVLDVNDNPPTFNQTDYVVKVWENRAAGSEIFTAYAIDIDEGVNGDFRYSLEPSPLTPPGLVAIDPESGFVVQRGSLGSCPAPKQCSNGGDSEEQQNCIRSCVYTVKATDLGNPTQTGRTFLHIHVIDMNDHAPKIDFRYYPEDAEFAVVDRDMDPGGVVTVVTATDEDFGNNGRVSLKLISGNDNDLFALDTSNLFGLVRLKKSLKWQRKNFYNLTIEASDSGTPQMKTIRSLSIYVKRDSLPSPQFVQTEYNLDIPESTLPYSFLTTIQVKPQESSAENEFSKVLSDRPATAIFSIIKGKAADTFAIDESSGLIRLLKPLDFETMPKAEFTVQARWNDPSNMAASTVKVKVNVIDENDNAPQFVELQHQVSVPEDASVGSVLLKVKATDLDVGQFGSITYTLSHRNRATIFATFELHPETGELKLRRPLDFEYQNHYQLAVEACDQGKHRLCGETSVLVEVQDVNDNRPVIYPTESWISFLTTSRPGTKIIDLRAEDLDNGDNGRVIFSILQSPVSSVEIDPESNVLQLKRIPFDRNLMDIVVTAHDQGGLTALGNHTIHVTFVTSSEALPKFEIYPKDVVEVTETTAVGTTKALFTVSATDSEARSQVVYHITDGDPRDIFEIGLFSGEVRLLKELDREVQEHYVLELTAVGKYGSTSVSVQIQVIDINDNAPSFEANLTSVDIWVEHSMATGQPLRHVDAVDHDSGDNSKLVFEYQDCADGIGVDPWTGVVRLQIPGYAIDYTPLSACHGKLTVSDHGNPQMSSSLNVNVHRSSDHVAPQQFANLTAEPVVNLVVPEDTKPFSKLHRITDRRIQVSTASVEDFLAISPEGWIFTTKPLDFEKAKFHSSIFTIHGAQSSDISIVQVNVYVTDVNDNSPQCAMDENNFKLQENQPPLTPVGVVRFHDPDMGGASRLVFSLSDPISDFGVDISSGMLSAQKSFDREELVRRMGSPNITVTVQACDMGADQKCGTCEILIEVTDENDNDPVFAMDSYEVVLPENHLPLSKVTKVSATDEDWGLNGLIEYSFAVHTELFHLDSTTGQITLKNVSLDRETAAFHVLQVNACDDGWVKRCTSTQVVITLICVNDNAPRGIRNQGYLNVSESAPSGFVVTTFHAYDLDDGNNGKFHFEIDTGNREQSFMINPTTGDLIVRNSLEFSTAPIYTLTILAVDHGTPSLTATFPVVIRVLDQNNHAPVIASEVTAGTVQENAPIGTLAIEISATDLDSGEYGELRYYIIEQTPSDAFSIDHYSGEIRTTRSIDREAADTYELEIEVSDSPGSVEVQHRVRKLITILIGDENDNTPTLKSAKATTVSALATAGYKVTTLSAFDPDAGKNGSVGFRMTSPHKHFGVGVDGSIYLKGQVSGYDVEPVYVLNIEMFDGYDPGQPYKDIDFKSAQKTLFDFTIIMDPESRSTEMSFLQQDFDFEVLENETIGSPLGRLPMKQKFPQGSVGYFITEIQSNGGAIGEVVSIDRKTGTLSVNSRLDADQNNGVIYISVTAATISGQLRIAQCAVKIRVIDVNDSPPVVSPSTRRVDVSEGASVGSDVFTIYASDPDEQGTLAYTFANLSSPFALHPTSGSVSLKRSLDREETPEYRLKYWVNDGKHSTPGKLIILVTDVNDNVPTFTEPAYFFTAWAGLSTGDVIGAVKATDRDNGNNGTVRYNLKAENQLFAIDQTTGVLTLARSFQGLKVVDEPNDVTDDIAIENFNKTVKEENGRYQVVWPWKNSVDTLPTNSNLAMRRLKSQIQRLQRDKKDENANIEDMLMLEVEAADQGYPPMQATVQVFITIMADLRPVLEHGQYQVDVNEDTPTGTELLKIEYRRNYYAPVKMFIAEGDDDEVFRIENDGSLKLKNQLDREVRDKYFLTIKARYSENLEDENKFDASTATVEVTVLDANDNSPKFSGSMYGVIRENAPAGTVIASVSVKDADEGINSKFFFELDPPDQEMFHIDPISGLLTNVVALDHETKKIHEIKVIAKDYGSPQLSSSEIFRVMVIDENDNDPKFLQTKFEAKVRENARPGTAVLQMRAMDLDSDGNAAVIYQIDDTEAAAVFEVLPETGLLIVSQNIPSGRHSMNFTVTAGNLNQLSAWSSAQVSLTIEPVNVHVPIFPEEIMQFDLYENLTSGLPAMIGRIRAVDLDSGPNGKLSYSIIQGNTSVFTVDATSGEIFAAIGVDREIEDKYELTITATDSGIPRLTGTCYVEVNILDLNDNAPVFQQPYYVMDAEESMSLGSVIGVMTAEDLDVGVNGEVRYSLLEKSSKFAIDPLTGEIRLTSKLDREHQDRYRVTVLATDQGSVIQLTTAITVDINVLDVNDNRPIIFHPDRTDVYVPDSANPGDAIFVVGASDKDLGENGELTFSIVSALGAPEPSVRIDNEGVVYLAEKLQLGQDHTVTIEVKDNGGAVSHSDNRTYRIQPHSAESFPVCSPGNREIGTVSEGKKRELVGQLTARSSKQPPFNRISFEIVSGNVGGGFNVDPNSGKLWTTDLIDREVMDKTTLWVSATDNDNPRLMSYCSLPIFISDVNDNAPKFDRAVYFAKVSENLPAGQLVIEVEASDADEGENGNIEYLISGGNDDGSFQIDQVSGRITTTVALDREILSKYRLQVQASDKGKPSLSSTSDVIIEVMDINDHAPRFTRLLSVKVPESTVIGTKVITVKASDLDTAENANNTYYFSKNPGDYFSINSYTGAVSIAKELDREQMAEHHLKVIVKDEIWRIETSLVISVSDLNDNAPRLSQSRYEFNVVESDVSFTNIGILNATDSDAAGPNSDIVFSLRDRNDFVFLNPTTGQLDFVRPVKFHPQSPDANKFHLTAIASDFGTPTLSSSVDVLIRVHASNSHPPVFTRSLYSVPLLTSSDLGEVVFTASAVDTDGGRVEYSIIEGSLAKSFRIDEVTGDVIVASPVTQLPANGSRNSITIQAEDDQWPPKMSQTTVQFFPVSEPKKLIPPVPSVIDITIEHRHPVGGVFLSHNDSIENIVSRIESSTYSSYFAMSSEGDVAVAKPLKTLPTNTVNITISTGYDGVDERHKAFTTIAIYVKNLLRFTQPLLEFFPGCNSEIWVPGLEHHLIGCPGARYLLKNSSLLSAIINPADGEIKAFAMRPGDSVELLVDAFCESANQYASTKVIISPMPCSNKQVFRGGIQKFHVPLVLEERDIVGFVSKVGDSGQQMFLDTAAVAKGFVVDEESGAIFAKTRINNVPNNFNVTVYAVPRCRGSAQCRNSISHASVTLILDSSVSLSKYPLFNNLSSIHIDETTLEGGEVFDVRNLIKLENVGQGVEFGLNPESSQFRIDQKSGRILLKDKSMGPLRGTYTVPIVLNYKNGGKIFRPIDIVVEQAHQKRQLLFDTNVLGSIPENRPAGTRIMQLYPRRALDQPQGGQYKFYLQPSDDANHFKIDETTGILSSQLPLDREIREFFYPVVEVKLEGSKTPTTDATSLTIQVSDVNDNPSLQQDFDVNIMTIADYEVNKISVNLHPRDSDALGDYQCSLLQQSLKGVDFDPDCTASIYPEMITDAQFSLKINGHDGKNAAVEFTSKINMRNKPLDSLKNSLRVSVETEQFYWSASSFAEAVNAGILSAEHILGVNIDTASIFVDSIGIPDQAKIQTELEKSGLRVKNVSGNPCADSPCLNGGSCSVKVSATADYMSFDSNTSHTWALPHLDRNYTCQCREDYSGRNCETLTKYCNMNPCQNGGNCSRSSGKIVCTCPPGFEGDRCQEDADECSTNSPCQNGGYCENTAGSYRCICLMGFSGRHCDQILDECADTPCQNGGTCERLAREFQCRCPFGYSGKHCEISSIGFDLESSLKLPGLDAQANQLSVEFSTIEKNALLLFSYDERASVSKDYVAVDIIDGRVRLSAHLAGRDIIDTRLDRPVDDGNWHRLDLKHDGEVIVLSVAQCHQKEKSCRQCVWGDTSCHASVHTGIQTLPVMGHSLFLGSVQYFADLLRRPSRIANFGFKGCVRNLQVNGHSLSAVLKSSSGYKLSEKCHRKVPQCGRSCAGGTCLDRWDQSICLCPGKFTAKECGAEQKSLSLTSESYIELAPTELYKRKLQFQPASVDGNPPGMYRDQPRFTRLAPGDFRHKRNSVNDPFEHVIRFRFRTLNPNSALLWSAKENHPEEYVYLNIVNGTMRFGTRSLRARAVQVQLEKMPNAADGKFHHVVLSYSSRHKKAEVQIDDFGKAVKFNDEVPELISPSTKISIGKAPEIIDVYSHPKDFSGCIYGLIINNELQDLWAPEPSSSNPHFNISFVSVIQPFVKKHCPNSPGCDQPPCPFVNSSQDVLHPGIISIISFFVALILIALLIFLVYHYRKSLHKSSMPAKTLPVVCSNNFSATAESRLTSLGSWASQQSSHSKPQNVIYAVPNNASMNTAAPPYHTSNAQRFDHRNSRDSSIDMLSPVAYIGGAYSNRLDATAGEDPERYDLDNASSIAPSDVDVGYHYRYNRNPSSRSKSGQKQAHNRPVLDHVIMPDTAPSSVVSGSTSMGRSRRPRHTKESKHSPVSSVHSNSRHGSHSRRRQASRSSKHRNITPADILSPAQHVIDTSSSSETNVQRRRAPPSRSSSARRKSPSNHMDNNRNYHDSSTELPSSDDERIPPAVPQPRSSLISASHLNLSPIGNNSWDRVQQGTQSNFPPHAGAIAMTTDDETDFPEDAVPDLSSFVNRSGELNNLIIGRHLSSSNETLSNQASTTR